MSWLPLPDHYPVRSDNVDVTAFYPYLPRNGRRNDYRRRRNDDSGSLSGYSHTYHGPNRFGPDAMDMMRMMMSRRRRRNMME